MWVHQLKVNHDILQQLALRQDFLHAKGKKGFRFSDNPDHYDLLVTVCHEKTSSKNITDKERFTILESLLEGDAKDMYKR